MTQLTEGQAQKHIRSQFDQVIRLLEDARAKVDNEARYALNEKDYHKVLESFYFAAITIKDRYPPYKRFLNQSLCRLLDNMVEELSYKSVKGHETEWVYRHISTLYQKFNHLISVVEEYKASAEASHLFDDSGIVEVDNRLVFIAMPFEPRNEMNELHATIRDTIWDFDADLKPLRTDDIAGDREIYETITKHIRKCGLFIAAVHDANPNVYFELGYARALHKKVVTIARTSKDLKFDIKQKNCIVSPDSEVIRHKLREWLSEQG